MLSLWEGSGTGSEITTLQPGRIMPASVIVDQLVNASEKDIAELDEEIEEQKKYVEKLQRARRVLASIVGVKSTTASKKQERLNQSQDERITAARRRVAQVLKDGPLSLKEVINKAKIAIHQSKRILDDEWFGKLPDGNWTLTSVGKEFGLI
jgi:seryl-tRNA synthetase